MGKPSEQIELHLPHREVHQHMIKRVLYTYASAHLSLTEALSCTCDVAGEAQQCTREGPSSPETSLLSSEILRVPNRQGQVALQTHINVAVVMQSQRQSPRREGRLMKSQRLSAGSPCPLSGSMSPHPCASWFPAAA